LTYVVFSHGTKQTPVEADAHPPRCAVRATAAVAARLRYHEGNRPLLGDALPLAHAHDRPGARRGRVARAGTNGAARPSRLPPDRGRFRARGRGIGPSWRRRTQGGARMKTLFSRAIMALAICCLDERRHEWSIAMRAEHARA